MGRRRKHFEKIGENKILACDKCGEEIKVSDSCESVRCGLCTLNQKVITNTLLTESANELNKRHENDSDEQKTIDVLNALDKEIEGLEAKVKVKRGRGRPRKNPVLPTEKKEKAMDNVTEKNVEVKGITRGKRGRKSTIGTAVLNFIKEQKGDVKFTDILGIYTTEREKLGKKATPEIESRNCYSTLYVLCRDGKIREVQKKSVYASI